MLLVVLGNNSRLFELKTSPDALQKQKTIRSVKKMSVTT